jgi:5-methylcytosine-specific restriction endonuclease McrA
MPNRILREGILTSRRVDRLSERVELLPAVAELHSESEVLAARRWAKALSDEGCNLSAYRWQLSVRLRAVRIAAAGYISQAKKMRFLRGANEFCPVCGRSMHFWKTGLTRSLDHIVPVSKGGRHEIANLRVICNRCNSKKRDH